MTDCNTSWSPGADSIRTWQCIRQLIPEVVSLVDAITMRIATFDDDTWCRMALPENEYRRDSYILRYGLTLAEIFGWPGRNDEIIADSLAVHFFWALTWRRLDNVLDADGVDQHEIGELASAIAGATRAHLECITRHELGWSGDVQSLLQLVCRTAAGERKGPIPIREIWTRAAPFFIVPRTILGFSADQEETYRAFINVDGLAHDVRDVLVDWQLGIKSLPCTWFREIDRDLGFNARTVEAWFNRAAHEMDTAISSLRERVDLGKCPLLSLFVRDAERSLDKATTFVETSR